MGIAVGKMARNLNQKLGLIAWLSGEPRPPKGGFDLDGEKLLDWGWLCAHLPHERKLALEIGPGKSPVIPAMLALDYKVVAIDFDETLANAVHGFQFIKGDFTKVKLDQRFEVVVACSVVEHIGLAGRYSSDEQPDGDLSAMKKIHDVLQDDGILLLTIPVGKDTIYRPFHRVYGEHRLPRLLAGFEVVDSHFRIKDPWGPWRSAAAEDALNYATSLQRYALGEFSLRKTAPLER